MSADAESLVLELEYLVDCKIDPATLNDRISAAHLQLDAVESTLDQVATRLQAVEGGNEFGQDLERLVNCKITETELETRINAQGDEVTDVTSDLVAVGVRMRQLEEGLASYLNSL